MNEKHKCGWANLRLCEKRYGMKSALYTGVICKHSNSYHPRILGANLGEICQVVLKKTENSYFSFETIKLSSFLR